MGQKPFEVRVTPSSCVAHFHTGGSREMVGTGNVEEALVGCVFENN
jgi:hypothetical protein